MGGVSGPALHPALVAAVEAARAAGEIALRYYRGGFEVTIKPDQTPVTQADREAEQAIRAVLGRAFPDWGFLGEEFGEAGSGDTRWIIDPIDGTKNFIRGIPFWAVLIGLEERGEITTGVVFNPVTGDLLTARAGEGAFANGERIRVSDCARMKDATLLHSGRKLLREDGCWDGFVRLVDGTARSRSFGDYPIVGAGKAHPRCRRAIGRTRRSSGSGSLNSCGRAGPRKSWRTSSNPRRRRSGTGCGKRRSTPASARTA